jgi:hypothetical protein
MEDFFSVPWIKKMPWNIEPRLGGVVRMKLEGWGGKMFANKEAIELELDAIMLYLNFSVSGCVVLSS